MCTKSRRTGGKVRISSLSLLLAGLAGACGEPATAPADDAEHVRLRDDARLVLEAHCGQCHIGDYDTALPRALAVFDLGETEWSAPGGS